MSADAAILLPGPDLTSATVLQWDIWPRLLHDREQGILMNKIPYDKPYDKLN